MKQITFKVDEHLHKVLKIAAANRGVSMNLLISRVLYKYLSVELRDLTEKQ